MKPLGWKYLQGLGLPGFLASFLFLFCIKICVCQDGYIRPTPDSFRPRPTSSPVLHPPSRAAPDRHPTSAYPPEIRPSASRDPIDRSRAPHSSVLPGQPRTTTAAVCKDGSCGATNQPSSSPSNTPEPSKCLILEPGKAMTESIPLRAGLVAVILDSRDQGAWQYSFDDNYWKVAICPPGQDLVLSVRSFVRFNPRVGFHGAVKFRVSQFKGSARQGSCVSMTTKPSVQYTVAVLVPPMVVPFSLAKAEKKIEINEDEVDRKGKQLSELFLVKNKTQLVVDKASLDCIPDDIKERHLAQIEQVNTNARPAITIIQAPDSRKGSLEYRFNRSDLWKPILMPQTKSGINSFALHLFAFVRFSPVPNANGKTSVKVVASAVMARAEPHGFNDLKPCARDFLNEMDKMNYVYSGLLDVIYKAFKITKEKEAVTIDGLLSTLQQLRRSVDRQILIDVTRAQDILEKVKSICIGKMKKNAFFKWYDKTIAPYVKKTPCEMIHGSKICLYSKQEIDLPIHILPVDDQPIIEQSRVFFSPIPNRLDATYEAGVPAFMLMNVDQNVVRKLIFGKKSDKLRQTMANGLKPDELIDDLPEFEQRMANYQKGKCAKDDDGDELGMAILSSSPSIRNETLGRWLFKKQGASSWEPMKKAFQDLRQDKKSCKPLALIKPGDRLKFEPRNSSLLWNNADAQEFTRLDFHAWEGKDNRTSGVHCVEFNTSSARFSNNTSSMIATRLGCNDMPGSMTTTDLCGVCNGNNECLGCDGAPNSGAKIECGICYGGKTGVSKPKRDCAKRCNTSFVDECGKCQSWYKLKKNFKDCAGTCMGARGYGARINKCNVCVGGVTGKPTNSGMDTCGKCDGDNSTCTDCNGIVKGTYRRDDCNNCLDPKSSDFNKCEQITGASSVTFPASGPSYVTVTATGIKTAKNASCVLQKGAERIALQKTTVGMATKTGVSSFNLQIKAVPPGSYSLKCKFDSSSTELEFTKQKLLFFDDKTTVVGSVTPSFALRNEATNVTILGSGFNNRTTAKCVLEIRKSPRSLLLSINASFISSSRVMCLIPPRLQTGEFQLGVVFSGTIVGMTSFAIKSIAPRTVKCQLSKNLRDLTITLDQLAALATRSTKCQDLFSVSSAKMVGTKARCQFKNKHLQVHLPADAPFIESGKMLTLMYRKIKNAVGKLTHYKDGITEMNVSCSRPSKPKPVTVEIRGAKSAGPCQKFRIEAKATGSGKLKYAWAAYFSNKTAAISANHQADMRKLNALLSKMKKASLVIQKQHVLPNVNYEVEVIVTDTSKQQGKAVVSLTRDDSKAPRIFIAGPKMRKVPANIPLRFKAIIAGSSQCRRVSARDKAVLYTWSCSSSSVEIKKFDLQSLFIRRNQLRPGKQYVFEVMACLANDQNQCSRASVTVVIESRPLECKIKGGKTRLIGEHDLLTLDGRASNDPDADPKEMKYSWSCEDPEGYTCYYPNKTNPIELNRLDIPDEPVVRINTTEQLPQVNGTYKFTLTVSKGNRSSTREIKIKVERGSPPKTKLFDIKNANPDRKIVVRGQVQSKAPVTQYEFSIVEESQEGYAYVDLEEEQDVVKSKIKGEVKRTNPRKPARKNVFLVFNPGKLAENATYKIRLTANYDNVTSYAEADLKTRATPNQGEVLIEPSEGVAANTTFTINAGDGWSVAEEDGPLAYRCGCIITNRRGRKRPKYFVEFSEKDSCETTLPPGDKANNHTLKCFIQACDVQGSCSREEQDVVVAPKKFDAGDIAKAKEELLESFAQGDLSSATSTMSSLLLSVQNSNKSSEEGEEEDDEVKKAIEDVIQIVIDKVLDSNENGETQSEDDKDLRRDTVTEAVEAAQDETLNEKRRKRLAHNVYEMEKAGKLEVEKTSRRKRRAVNEQNPDVETKTPEQVEQTLNLYRRIIQPSNFSNDSMTAKEQFLDLLDELGRSMCKGLSTGETPLTAESNTTVLRSEKNSFEHVHTVYNLIGCDNCSLYDSKIAQVLLGKSLKDMYGNWDCNEDGCNGACVVSAQMSDDLLIKAVSENRSRVSDVVYVKLFNPETLVAMTIPELAEPISFDILLINVTDTQSSKIKCHQWDASSSSWTTTDVTTNAMTAEKGQITINCTSSHLGFFAVFDLSPKQSQSTSTASPTTSKTSQTTNLGPTTATSNDTATTPTDTAATSSNTASTPTDTAATSSDNAAITSHTGGPSVTSKNDQQTEIQFSLDANFNDVIDDNNKASFITTLKSIIASQLGVDESRIWNLSVLPGSIIVQFILLPGGIGQQSVQNLTESLRNLVQSGTFTVILSDGQRLDVVRSSFSQGFSIPSITPPPSTVTSTNSNEVKESGISQTTLIAIIVAGSVVALTILAVVLFYCLRKKDQNQKVKAIEEQEEKNWTEPLNTEDIKGHIPMKGIDNKGHLVEEVPMSKRSAVEPRPSLPGTPSYDHD